MIHHQYNKFIGSYCLQPFTISNDFHELIRFIYPRHVILHTTQNRNTKINGRNKYIDEVEDEETLMSSFMNKSKTVPVRVIDKTERQESCLYRLLCILSFLFVLGFDKDSATFSGQFEEQKKGPMSDGCGSHVTTKFNKYF